MQRFLTQSAAIAITTQLAACYGWDAAKGHRLFWFDDLKVHAPSVLHAMLPASGPFPDLLCETPRGWISLESRGRTGTKPSQKNVPNSPQRKRLAELHAWASSVRSQTGADPQWGMGWAWFGNDDSRIDFFDPGEPMHFEASVEKELADYALQIDAWFRRVVSSAGTGRRAIRVHGSDVRAAIATADSSDTAEVRYAGLAVGDPGLTRRTGTQRREDFDVLQYRGILLFAGTTNRDELETLDDDLGLAIEREFG
jgi:hypothetical protein